VARLGERYQYSAAQSDFSKRRPAQLASEPSSAAPRQLAEDRSSERSGGSACGHHAPPRPHNRRQLHPPAGLGRGTFACGYDEHPSFACAALATDAPIFTSPLTAPPAAQPSLLPRPQLQGLHGGGTAGPLLPLLSPVVASRTVRELASICAVLRPLPSTATCTAGDVLSPSPAFHCRASP
jgi:hypothetical protein